MIDNLGATDAAGSEEVEIARAAGNPHTIGDAGCRDALISHNQADRGLFDVMFRREAGLPDTEEQPEPPRERKW